MKTQQQSMVEAVRRWLRQYDELTDTRIDVDHLGAGIGSFSIFADGMPETLSTFMLERQRRRTFFLCRECPYGDDAEQNTDNLSWYETFSHWVYEQDLCRNYPVLGDGFDCFGVADTTAGSVVTVTENGKAEYRIALTIDYTERMLKS